MIDKTIIGLKLVCFALQSYYEHQQNINVVDKSHNDDWYLNFSHQTKKTNKKMVLKVTDFGNYKYTTNNYKNNFT